MDYFTGFARFIDYRKEFVSIRNLATFLADLVLFIGVFKIKANNGSSWPCCPFLEDPILKRKDRASSVIADKKMFDVFCRCTIPTPVA